MVALWPPNQTGLSNTASVDPPVPTVALVKTGVSLDDALGVGAGAVPVLTLSDLKARFGACDGGGIDPNNGPLPAGCTAGPARALLSGACRVDARRL